MTSLSSNTTANTANNFNTTYHAQSVMKIHDYLEKYIRVKVVEMPFISNNLVTANNLTVLDNSIENKLTTLSNADTSSVSLIIKTYTVNSTNKSGKVCRGGPDDQTYINFPELIDLVPRGCSDLFMNGNHIGSLRGLKKFDGTSAIDEDEVPYQGANESDRTSIFPSDKVEKWESTGELKVEYQYKANGKFVIFTVLQINGSLGIFGGSKNVHVWLSFDEYEHVVQKQINECKLDKKYNELHYQMLFIVARDLLTNETLTNSTFTNETLTNITNCIKRGVTYCGEFLDGKHLVYQNCPPYIVYFDNELSVNLRPRTNSNIQPTTNSNTQPTNSTTQLSNIIKSAQINKLPTQELLQSIRDIENEEGVVIVYKNIRTGETYRQKHKTKWYIILRCWREIISKLDKNKINTSELISKLLARLNERSSQFLHLTNEEISLWSTRAIDFAKWLYDSKYQYRDVGPFSEIGMATVWYNYLTNVVPCLTAVNVEAKDDNRGTVDNTEFETKDNTDLNSFASLYWTDYFQCVENLAKNGYKVCIIMSGLPGSGKSWIAKPFEHVIKQWGVTCSIFSTDDLFVIDGRYQFDAKLLARNHQKNLDLFTRSDSTVRIVDNTNLARWEYSKYLKAADDCICIMFQTKLCDISFLERRNRHGVDRQSLEKMASKYTITGPSYLGIFVKRSDISCILKQNFGQNKISVTQATPLHITYRFIGGDENKVRSEEFALAGKKTIIYVYGLSINKAGTCLLVYIQDPQAEQKQYSTHPFVKNEDGIKFHIILHTNDKFKPADVGKMIDDENIICVTSRDNTHGGNSTAVNDIRIFGYFSYMW